MPASNFPRLPASRPILLLLVLVAVLCWHQAGGLSASAILLLALLLAALSRRPPVSVPAVPLAIVSPVDGLIVGREDAGDPWLKRDALKLSLHLGWLDAPTLRSPIEGKVMQLWRSRRPDTFSGRRYTCWIQTDEQDDVVVSFALGMAAPLVKMQFITGQRVGQGNVVGFLYFSGRVDLYLPANTCHDLAPGHRLRAGRDILGRFVHD